MRADLCVRVLPTGRFLFIPASSPAVPPSSSSTIIRVCDFAVFCTERTPKPRLVSQFSAYVLFLLVQHHRPVQVPAGLQDQRLVAGRLLQPGLVPHSQKIRSPSLSVTSEGLSLAHIFFARTASLHKLVLSYAILCALIYWGTGVIYSEYTHYFQKVKDERIASLVGLRNGEKERLLYPEKDRAAQLLLTAEQLHIYNYQDQLP